MVESTQIHVKGLFLFLLTFCVSIVGLKAQGGIQGLTKELTSPAQTATKTVKGVAEPARDVNRGIKTAVDAPTRVVNEYEKVGTEVERTKNEYEKTGDQIAKATGKGDQKNDKPAQDTISDKTVDAAKSDGKTNDEIVHKTAVPADYVPVKKATPALVPVAKGGDPNDVPRPVPPGSRDNKTPSGPLPASEATKTVATGGTDVDPIVVAETRTVSIPDTAMTMTMALPTESTMGNEATSGEVPTNRLVEVKTVPRSGEKRPKPDYSYSPARIPLEKAEFDIETLEELFRYSNWEGPEREHTVRSVANALDEMQQSIVEIKKLDPGQSTWRFEESYKDMKAAYIAEMKKVR